MPDEAPVMTATRPVLFSVLTVVSSFALKSWGWFHCRTDRRDLRGRPNSARFTFLDPAAQEFFFDWEKVAKDLVATLRSQAGRNPYDRALSDLVGELSTRSDAFRTWWAAHNVRYHHTGSKRLHHPVVGDLELSYEVMEVAADAGLRLAIFTAEPASRSQEALNLLASWGATPTQLPSERLASDDARRP